MPRPSTKGATARASKSAEKRRIEPRASNNTRAQKTAPVPFTGNTLSRAPKGEVFDQYAGIEELPPCPGPKLKRFQYHQSKIEWLERIDHDLGERSGMQGYVFHVRIRSQDYAIKVFREFDAESRRYYWELYLGPAVSPDTVAYYMDPFYCECRAYGRIQEAIDRREIKASPALACYGFIYLTPEDEKNLEDRGLDLRYEDSDVESTDSTSRQRPLRAIVKKLGRPPSGVTVRKQGQILVNIRTINSLGIYNRDIRAKNYREGLLVDFGSSMTEPDIILNKFDDDEAAQVRAQDRAMFETMLKNEKIKIKVDVFSNSTSQRHLRPRRKEFVR